ncbi:MAG: Yip1 family protein [Bacillota bacterium]
MGEQLPGPPGGQASTPGKPAAAVPPEERAAAVPPEKPPLGVLELMYGALFSPVATFREVAARPHLGRAVVVLVVVAAVSATVGAISGGREFTAGMAEAGVPVSGASFGPVAFLFGLVGPFLFWYLQTAIFYLTGVLLGGKGPVLPLMAALAVASMPQVFSAPVMLVSTAVHQGLGVWLSLAVGIWVIVLNVLAVREALHFSTGRAIATLVLPLAVIVVLMVGAVIAFAVAFLPLFQQFMPGTMPPIP